MNTYNPYEAPKADIAAPVAGGDALKREAPSLGAG
jgi:hypothetical protein